MFCQCDTARGAKNELAKAHSSSIASAGILRVLKILDRRIVVALGFHPSYFTRWIWSRDELGRSNGKDDDRADDRTHEQIHRKKIHAPFSKSLLELAFLTAINAATGRKITPMESVCESR